MKVLIFQEIFDQHYTISYERLLPLTPKRGIAGRLLSLTISAIVADARSCGVVESPFEGSGNPKNNRLGRVSTGLSNDLRHARGNDRMLPVVRGKSPTARIVTAFSRSSPNEEEELIEIIVQRPPSFIIHPPIQQPQSSRSSTPLLAESGVFYCIIHAIALMFV